jgi:hypothetical protein
LKKKPPSVRRATPVSAPLSPAARALERGPATVDDRLPTARELAEREAEARRKDFEPSMHRTDKEQKRTRDRR